MWGGAGALGALKCNEPCLRNTRETKVAREEANRSGRPSKRGQLGQVTGRLTGLCWDCTLTLWRRGKLWSLSGCLGSEILFRVLILGIEDRWTQGKCRS